MPQSDRIVRAGFTHMEPRDIAIVPPRLFRRKQDAKCALTHWLDGVTSCDITGENWHTEPADRRKRNPKDMTVVEMEIGEI